jgi:Uma2 family endonuclease
VKKEIFAQKGVREMWIIAPKSRTVRVFDFEKDAESPVLTFGENGSYESPLLPELVFEGARIFAQRV